MLYLVFSTFEVDGKELKLMHLTLSCIRDKVSISAPKNSSFGMGLVERKDGYGVDGVPKSEVPCPKEVFQNEDVVPNIVDIGTPGGWVKFHSTTLE